jgi:hypothetical protein
MLLGGTISHLPLLPSVECLQGAPGRARPHLRHAQRLRTITALEAAWEARKTRILEAPCTLPILGCKEGRVDQHALDLMGTAPGAGSCSAPVAPASTQVPATTVDLGASLAVVPPIVAPAIHVAPDPVLEEEEDEEDDDGAFQVDMEEIYALDSGEVEDMSEFEGASEFDEIEVDGGTRRPAVRAADVLRMWMMEDAVATSQEHAHDLGDGDPDSGVTSFPRDLASGMDGSASLTSSVRGPTPT